MEGWLAPERRWPRDPQGGREGAGRERADPADLAAVARHHGLHAAHQGAALQLSGNRVGRSAAPAVAEHHALLHR